ncbi:MAG: DNA-processing protein DprA [Mariprofundaceae bacterium]|nr:DNA-processing protein DprA [Mariprofundaceae bacterium]
MPCSDSAIAYLRLMLARGVGPRVGRQLISAFGSVEALWRTPAAGLEQCDGVSHRLATSLRNIDHKAVEAVIRSCDNSGISLVCPEDESYPRRLLACDDAPLMLFVQGDTSVLNNPYMLSVVGARKASREGRVIARRWSRYCSERGVTIVSGMAYGIDAAAHGGALEGDAGTVAVLGSGLKAVTGESQQRQLKAIAGHGCVISQYLPDVEARPEQFPQRNRVIAGLSQATLVVEATIKSGSMITAGQAAGYGREVFAVPGSVLNDAHAGCHQLIRDGAILAGSAGELLQHLGWMQKRSGVHAVYTPANEEEAKIMHALQQEIMHLDALSEACGLTVPQLSPSLLALELQGVIERLPGSRYTLGGKN